MFDLKDDLQSLYSKLDDVSNPRQAIDDHNKAVQKVLDNALASRDMIESWSSLKIDREKYILNKVKAATSLTDEEKAKKAFKILKNFGITGKEAKKIYDDDRFKPKEPTLRDPANRGAIGTIRRIEQLEKGLK